MTSPSLTNAPGVDDWLCIETDGTVVVRTGKVDIGQRIGLAIARIAAEELDVDPGRIRVQPASTESSPDEGYTSGSNSVHQSGIAMRLACATARRELLSQAAAAMGVPVADLVVEDGLIRAVGANQAMRYEELTRGEPFAVPVDPRAPVKSSGDHTLVGIAKESVPAALTPRIDGLLDGTAAFLHDFRLPGLLHARVLRPPHYHARLAHWPGRRTDSLSLPEGAHAIRDGSFVAVAASDEYTAVKAARSLASQLRWSDQPGLQAGDIFAALKTGERFSRPVVGGTPQDAPVPPLAPVPASAAHTVSACYERPYTMHGSIGPSAAAALFENGSLRVWSHTQGIYPLRGSLAEALDMAPESITVQHAPGAGCYGHNGADDAALDAAMVARALPGRPVLLKWTREDEHAWEPYASCMAIDMQASVSADGDVLSWSHEAYSDTHLGRPRPGKGTGGARMLAAQHRASPLIPTPARPWMVNHAGLHRNADPIYRFQNPRVIKHLVPGMPLRTSSMRTLGGFANVFAIECFMDELALRLAVDPFAFRLRHLDDPRSVDCLTQLRARMQAWRKPADQRNDKGKTGGADEPGDGGGGRRGQGIGFARYKNQMAYAAVGVEVEIGDDAVVRLRRAVVVGDTGQVIDRDGAAAQLEGGLLQAASWCLYETVGFDRGGITSTDWDSYPILRFDNVPDVEVDLIARQDQPPLGIGEASSGPAGAAIANAIFAASGLRLRRMPFSPDAVRQAALAD